MNRFKDESLILWHLHGSRKGDLSFTAGINRAAHVAFFFNMNDAKIDEIINYEN